MIRKIIKIDEEKCNGCGLCAAACHEGAIGMAGGKAKLLREDYCDGLGDCLPACPANAISFETREAPAYDAAAVARAKAQTRPCQRALFSRRPPSRRGRLHRVRLRRFSWQIYPRPRHTRRLSQTGYGGLFRKTDGDLKGERYSEPHSCPYGSAVLRQNGERSLRGAGK